MPTNSANNTQTQSEPSQLELFAEINRSRATSAGLDPSQYDAVTAMIDETDQWLDAFRAAGEEHLKRARRAEEENRSVSAADAFVDASLWFHFAACVPNHNREAYLSVEKRSAEALRNSLTHSDPTAEYIDNWDGKAQFTGLLQRPADENRPPVVIIIPGLDSSKEEFQAIAQELLRRGLATFSIDGPGQGELAATTTPCPEYENVVQEAIDYLQERDDIDHEHIGAIGLSLGGYYVARSAAFEPRIFAAVANGGPYSFDDWDELLPPIQEILNLRAGNTDKAKEIAERIDLTDVAQQIVQPLLVINSDHDPLIPATDAQRLVSEASNAQLLSIPEGDHMCMNTVWKWQPYTFDWLAMQLDG